MLISNMLRHDEIAKLKVLANSISLKKQPPTNKYEILRIKDGDILIVVYSSGKIVYENNPSTMEILDKVMKKTSVFDYELGSDEVGKGEWYGPLVVVCAALKVDDINYLRKLGIKDSKELSNNEISRLSKEIQNRKIIWHSLVLMPETYNSQVEKFKKENKNLNDLLAWAHSVCVKNLLEQLEYSKIQVVIDKFDVEKTYYRLQNIDRKKVTLIQKSKGESETPVAVASVLAKNLFNEKVKNLCKHYGMDFSKIDPKDISKDILKKIAKLHFKNISDCL